MADVDVRMPLCAIIAVGVRLLLHFDRDGDKLAMPHPPLGDDLFGEMMDLVRSPTQQRNLHAARMIEVNLQGGDRQIVMMVMHVGKALGELPHGVIKDINKRRDAFAIVARVAARFTEGTGSLRGYQSDPQNRL